MSSTFKLTTSHLEFAIDGEIEDGEVARSPRDLQLGADRPDVLRPERRLRADEFSFVPGS